MNIYVSRLVEEIVRGKVVLPDFQREFVWDSERVRELIVSVLGNYFIGSMLVLEDFRQDDCQFALRLFYGVTDINKFADIQPVVHVILDGQQRATALLYALQQPDINLKNRKNPYKFYINIQKALEHNWDEAVIAVNTANKRDFAKIQSSPHNIQLTDFVEPSKLQQSISGNPNSNEIWRLSQDFATRPIHVVSLRKDTDLKEIAETFERVNRFTVSLTTFELLTARLRKYKINLPDFWLDTKRSYEFAQASSKLDKEFVPKVISLLRGQGVKRGDLLDLDSNEFEQDWTYACKYLNIAYRRLLKQYGVLTFPKWVPYIPMMVPLAAILAFCHTNKLEFENNYSKIDRWYWTSVFRNRYDEGASSKQESDFRTLMEWVKDDRKIPDFIKDFKPNRDVNLTVEKQNAATYKGVINLIVLEGALDFLTGQPPQLDEEHVQDDHIFPKSIYNEHRILNRTILTTNAKKSKTLPSDYFEKQLSQHGESTLKKILASHLIPEDALQYLLNDSIQQFIRARRTAVLKKIKQKIKVPS